MPASIKDLETVFSNIIISFLALGGFILFLMFLFGGFKYLNSGGDGKNIENAQKTLTYAVGGFIILAGSIIILKIIGEFTGTSNIITIFKIYK